MFSSLIALLLTSWGYWPSETDRGGLHKSGSFSRNFFATLWEIAFNEVQALKIQCYYIKI